MVFGDACDVGVGAVALGHGSEYCDEVLDGNFADAVPRQLYWPVWSQSVLPFHLLGLALLLGCVGPVSGDVKLEDDGVMDQPVVPEFMPAAFVFPTAARRPQGRCQTPRRHPKCLRLSHADALSDSRGFPPLALSLEKCRTAPLVQHHAVAGQ